MLHLIYDFNVSRTEELKRKDYQERATVIRAQLDKSHVT